MKSFHEASTSPSHTVEQPSTEDSEQSSRIPSAHLAGTQIESNRSQVRKSRSMTPVKGAPLAPAVESVSTVLSNRRRGRSISPASSSRTSIAPQQPKLQAPFCPPAIDEVLPSVESPSLPHTPTFRGTPLSNNDTPSLTPAWPRPFSVGLSDDSPRPPPPPPPPPLIPATAPRVDYLMQHGGLPHPVPKEYLHAYDDKRPVRFSIGDLPDPTAMSREAESFFAPFSKLLEDYAKVMSKNGSIAVATGYRSIARRLLDRLETVFARDISSEICNCVMCTAQDRSGGSEGEVGVSWGEILEYVSGRQELPQWPPFILLVHSDGLGISPADFKAPMQKLDIDVPDEYREHYIRQSKKTKQSVDHWLAGQMDATGPPDEADDDTLTFAILTHLDSDERSSLSQLLGVPSSRPPSIALGTKAAPSTNDPTTDFLSRTGLAIQRLYRLPSRPRLPESALYLLKNHHLHDVLATLAAISDGEWDILTSGRFDGFLRSGAYDALTMSPPVPIPIPIPSRGSTPANLSRSYSGSHQPATPGPGSTGAPVAMDEETEIATLAEVEREIFVGMEALEDAFEALHVRAETVRRNLRERGAGLAVQAQARKGANAAVLEARLGTPSVARSWDSETDDGIDDAISELAPDDSASNISRSRMRRPRRRTERRTPAPVEEGDEDAEEVSASARTVQAPGRESRLRSSLRKK